MRDRPLLPGDHPEADAELERRLRAAFGGAAAPEAPAAVHAEVARLAAVPDIRTRAGFAGWLSRGWVAVALAVSVLLVGSLLSGGSSPAPTVPSAPPGPSGSAEASLASPGPNAGSSDTCDESPGTVHGTWWREIGGPNAFFNWEEGGPRPAGTSWKLFVRFDPDAGPDEEVSVWAGRLGSEMRARGRFNSRMDPQNIYHLDSPAPDLPGGWYFFEQPLPTAGCWQLTAAIAGRLVGTATVEVGPPSRSAPPTNAPTPEVEQTRPPAATMKPSPDDVLPLAGRDGLPGSLYCGSYMPFAFDALEAPTGAEDRIGPEFDVLRQSAGSDPDPGGDYGPDPTFREVARDTNAVLFLYEQPADTIEDFRYLYKKIERDGTGWRLTASGDCTPRAVQPSGYEPATWTRDLGLRPSGRDTRKLDILVQELACSSGRSASGRISPAFVTWDDREIVIEVFVESAPGGGDCQGVPPTPATLLLPVPLGSRTLVDPVTLEQGGAGD